MNRYVASVAGAWSQFWNAVWGGHRDQSFSSRAWEARCHGKAWGSLAVAVIDRLFFWERGHCERAFRSDSERTYG